VFFPIIDSGAGLTDISRNGLGCRGAIGAPTAEPHPALSHPIGSNLSDIIFLVEAEHTTAIIYVRFLMLIL
jgi:hypothetical protein